MEINDSRVKNSVNGFIKNLLNRNESIQREYLKILMIMELSARQEARLFDSCMSIWESIEKKPGVRVNAFRILVKIITNHPELKNELVFLTQDHFLETLSPGVKWSVKKLLTRPGIRLLDEE